MTGRAKPRELVRTRSVALGRVRISGIDNVGEALAAAECVANRAPAITAARAVFNTPGEAHQDLTDSEFFPPGSRDC
jgi:hypothetical protein